MRCPLDRNDMIVVEHKRIELDYCLACSGVWFDKGELDLLISALGLPAGQTLNNLIGIEKAEVPETKRKCPICGKKMDKVWLGKAPRVLIDTCPLEDGLWFDGGELQQVIRQLAPGSKTENVIAFLGEAFPSDPERKGKKAA